MATTTIDYDVPVPADDGVTLRSDVLRPAGGGRHPTILMRTAYDRTSYAAVSLQVHALRLAAAGYAVVLQDIRGRFASGGEFVPFVNELRDGIATLNWIISRPWSNGTVAGGGISYNAFSQQVLASSAHPSYATWVPGLGPADVRTSWIRLGGAFNYGFHLAWGLGMIAAQDPTVGDRALAAMADPLATAGRGPLDQPVLRDTRGAEFYFRWLSQRDPYPDDKGVPGLSDLDGVDTPALVVSGMYDIFHSGSMDLYRALSSSEGRGHALILGPWDHSGLPLGRRAGEADFGPAAAIDLGNLQRAWYDFHLRGIGEVAAPARVFVTGAGEWVQLPAWPPPSSPWVLEPDASGGLVDAADAGEAPIRLDLEHPTPTRGGRVYPFEPVVLPGSYDQRSLEHRDDVLAFTSEPLLETMRVQGAATVEATIESSEAGTDVFAVLCDVGPDGVAWNIADGVARRERIEAGGARLTIAMGDIAHEFAHGRRVRLMLSAGSFPRFDAFHWRGERVVRLGGGATRLILPLVSS